MKSLAKLLTALMLGVMVILGAGTLTVKAADWEAPKWENQKLGEVKWKLPGDYKAYPYFVFELYKDGQRLSTYRASSENIEEDYMCANLSSYIFEAGSYTVKVLGYFYDEKGKAVFSGNESPFSEAYLYDVWEAPFWGDKSRGEVKWKLPDDYKSYPSIGFKLYKDWKPCYSYWITPDDIEHMDSRDGYISVELGRYFHGPGSYTVIIYSTVRDENGMSVASGAESSFSEPYDFVWDAPLWGDTSQGEVKWKLPCDYKSYAYIVFELYKDGESCYSYSITPNNIEHMDSRDGYISIDFYDPLVNGGWGSYTVKVLGREEWYKNSLDVESPVSEAYLYDVWETPFWGNQSRGEVMWKLPGNYKSYPYFVLELDKDGQKFTTFKIESGSIELWYSQGGYMTVDLGCLIDGAGSYTVKVLGYVYDENGKAVFSGNESPFSDAFDYVPPERKLPTPSNLRWAEYDPYEIYAVCDRVEEAETYNFTLWRGDNYVITRTGYGAPGCSFMDITNETPGEYTFTVQAVSSNILTCASSEKSGHSPVYISGSAEVDPSTLDCKWYSEGGKSFWYEGGVRQGTYDDPNGVVGFGTVRGREIYDPESNAWYWLDAVYDGAKAIGKEVWMPYIYQNEAEWDDATKRNIANESDPGMEDLVYEYMVNGTGKWVRYDEEGRMLKGWVEIKGTLAEKYPDQENNIYYYDNRTGLMAKGFITMDGKVYHFDEITGVLDQIDGKPL